jgi:cytochrome oxidase assembly protein ShyY1
MPALSDWWAVCVSAPISPVSLPGLFLNSSEVIIMPMKKGKKKGGKGYGKRPQA